MPAAFADLAALPPERIMTPIDLGSHMLAFTHHAVVAAPYHRNQEAVLDAFHFFNEPIDEAREILEARGIGLVVICPAMKEIRGLVDHDTGFVREPLCRRQIARPGSSTRACPASPLKIYAVTAALELDAELGARLLGELAATVRYEAHHISLEVGLAERALAHRHPLPLGEIGRLRDALDRRQPLEGQLR